MPITLEKGCQGVCLLVQERLRTMGMLTPQEIRHQPIFDALDKITFVTSADLQELMTFILTDQALPHERVEELRKRYTGQ